MNQRFAKGCALMAAMMLAAIATQAQPNFGGFNPFGGQQQGGQRTSNSRSGNTAYPSSTDVGQARITYDAEKRVLIVVSDDETANHIREVVAELDRPAPQVLIKCVFVEATYNKDLDIGVDGTYQHRISGSSVDAVNTPAGQFNTASTAFDLATSGGMYHLLGENLDVTLSALAKAGKTEILSRPSVLARNNQQATITIGQRVPLINGVNYDAFGNQRNSITYENVGIILQVTPFITQDGMVEMILAPQISSISDSAVNFATGSSTNGTTSSSAPIINLRSADTVAVVPDKQTVVIGGLMQNSNIKTESKVPILGDIPLVGLLFKHKVTNKAKTELLIFVTPNIVKDPRELAAASEAAKLRKEVEKKSFGKEEVDKFIDRIEPPQNPTPTQPSPDSK